MRESRSDDRCFVSLRLRLSPLRGSVHCVDSHPRVETRGYRLPSLCDLPLPTERGGRHRCFRRYPVIHPTLTLIRRLVPTATRCRHSRLIVPLLHEVQHETIGVRNEPFEIDPSSRAHH